jgi:hypothetical protein
MDKVQETSGSQCNIPSSKPFRIQLKTMLVSAQQLILWLTQKLPTTRETFPSNLHETVKVPFIRSLPTQCKHRVAEVLPTEM